MEAIKLLAVIHKLLEYITVLYSSTEDYTEEVNYFKRCIQGLLLEDTYKYEFKVHDKELLIHFNDLPVSKLPNIKKYFSKIYGDCPIKNHLGALNSIKVVEEFYGKNGLKKSKTQINN